MSSERPLQVNNQRFFRKARYGRDRFVLVRHDKIHFVEVGQGEPVLFIPGSHSSFRIWNRLMPLLEHQYRLMALDHVDLTEIKNPQQTEAAIRRQADLMAAMIQQMKLGKVKLIGANLGGAAAFNLAARYPELVEHVVSISGYIGARSGQPHPDSKSVEQTDKPFVSLLAEDARAIKCPIFYLYGTKTDSREFPLAYNLDFLQRNHPQAWIVALEGGIFEIALKNPAEITALIADFFKFKPGIRIG